MPATEQLNIRVTSALKRKFRERATREGLSQAGLLDALLRQRGTLPPPDPEAAAGGRGSSEAAAPGPVPSAVPDAAPNIDFVVWLAGRLGMPRALVAEKVKRGQVTVAGVPWTMPTISRELLQKPIAYDGEPVRPAGAGQ